MSKVAAVSQKLFAKLAERPELGRVDLDMQLDLPTLKLSVDRTRAASAGLASVDIASALNVLAGGLDVAKYSDEPGDGERYDIRLKAAPGQIAAPGQAIAWRGPMAGQCWRLWAWPSGWAAPSHRRRSSPRFRHSRCRWPSATGGWPG